jgi:hypothetical protein
MATFARAFSIFIEDSSCPGALDGIHSQGRNSQLPHHGGMSADSIQIPVLEMAWRLIGTVRIRGLSEICIQISDTDLKHRILDRIGSGPPAQL